MKRESSGEEDLSQEGIPIISRQEKGTETVTVRR